MHARAARYSLLAFLSFIASSCGGDSTGPEIQPPPPSVATVSVSPDEATLVPQQTRQLAASVRDQSGNALTDRTVAWSSNSASVASVSGTGLVTATGSGTATITATSDGKSGTATITVRNGLFITGTGATMTVGAVQVVVPSGAVSTGTAFTADAVASPPAHERLVSGTAWSLGPDGASFAQPVRVRLSWTAAQESGHDPSQFAVHRWNGTTWVELTDRVIDIAGRTVSGETSAFSIFAILELPGEPVPVLSAIEPAEAIAGGAALTLTATGSNFATGSVLRWNGEARPTTVASATSLTATIVAADIAAAGTAQVTVFTPAPGGGESAALSFTIVAPNPTPTLTAIDPATVEAGSEAFTLVVTGSGFIQGAEVRWNGAARPTTFVSATELSAAIPAADVSTDGSAQISVFNPAPGGGVSEVQTLSITAPPPPPPAGPVALSAGGEHTCGTTSNGVPYCWGNGQNGELGTGATTIASTPVAVVGGHAFSQITGGGPNTCGITVGGQAYCWGSGNNGRLGNGASANSASPSPVSGGLTFQSISTGPNHSCAVSTDDRAYCWGFSFNGGLGGGVMSQSKAVPTLVLGGHVFEHIVVGISHSCALTPEGAAYCWGPNQSGQLGTGGTESTAEPVAVAGGHEFAELVAGSGHNCGLDQDGKAYCWGSNSSGQLGIGSIGGQQEQPVEVAGGLTFKALTAGTWHTCGLRSDDVLMCWGADNYGQLGIGSAAAVSIGSPQVVAGGLTFARVSAAGFSTCGIANSQAWCWGQGTEGAIGDGGLMNRLEPVQVSGGHAFVNVFGGSDHSCAVTESGAAWCWGTRSLGQLGDGLSTTSARPVQVVGGHQFVQVAAGGKHSCGITSAGTAYCWGRGDLGMLGTGDTDNRFLPTAVAGGHSFSSISAGLQHTCALTADGTAYCWGDGSLGRLGIGSQNSSMVPVPVAGGRTYTMISAGATHSCAVAEDGGAYCWGFIDGGPSADFGFGFSPSLLGGGHTLASIDVGGDVSCGVTNTGKGFCWGRNDFGQLGNGATTNVHAPVEVAGGHTFTRISAGGMGSSVHACGITTSGAAYCWGRGLFGQLGTGSSGVTSSTPLAVTGGHLFVSITAGMAHTCGVTTSGVAMCWGSGSSGRLGLGHEGGPSTPQPVAPPAGSSFIVRW